jgi:hypothetical protein
VDDLLAGWPPATDPGDGVVVWKVEEHGRAWILHFATRGWLDSRDFRDQLVGACPFVVDKETGQVHPFGSAPQEHDKFTAWLDGNPI